MFHSCKSAGQGNEPLKCEHCNWNGHTKDNCYQFIGYPPGHLLHKPQNKSFNKRMNKAMAKQMNVVDAM